MVQLGLGRWRTTTYNTASFLFQGVQQGEEPERPHEVASAAGRGAEKAEIGPDGGLRSNDAAQDGGDADSTAQTVLNFTTGDL